jgi:hypothetical protein
MPTYQITVMKGAHENLALFDTEQSKRFFVPQRFVTVLDPNPNYPVSRIWGSRVAFPVFTENELTGWCVTVPDVSPKDVYIHYIPEVNAENIHVAAFLFSNHCKPVNPITTAEAIKFLQKTFSVKKLAAHARLKPQNILDYLSLLNLHPDLIPIVAGINPHNRMRLACAINLCKLPTEMQLPVWNKLRTLNPSKRNTVLARAITSLGITAEKRPDLALILDAIPTTIPKAPKAIPEKKLREITPREKPEKRPRGRPPRQESTEPPPPPSPPPPAPKPTIDMDKVRAALARMEARKKETLDDEEVGDELGPAFTDDDFKTRRSYEPMKD